MELLLALPGFVTTIMVWTLITGILAGMFAEDIRRLLHAAARETRKNARAEIEQYATIYRRLRQWMRKQSG